LTDHNQFDKVCLDRPAEIVETLLKKLKETFFDKLDNFEFTSDDFKCILRAILSALVSLRVESGKEIEKALQSHQLSSGHLGE